MNIDWGVAGNVVFSGLIIVFFVLVMLILLVTLMGKALSRRKVSPPSAPVSVPAPAVVPVVSRPAAVPAAAAAAGESGEVIAVISAAVSTYMEETAPGTAYAITGIHPRPGRVKDSRPAWGFAGMRQNTEPF